MKLEDTDIRVDVFRNAVPTSHPDYGNCAVRVTHMPTGMVETLSVPEDAPSQFQAKALAMQALYKRLTLYTDSDKESQMSPIEMEILSAYLLGDHARVRALMLSMDQNELHDLRHTFEDLANSCEDVLDEMRQL